MFDLLPTLPVHVQRHPLSARLEEVTMPEGDSLSQMVELADLDPRWGTPIVTLQKGGYVWRIDQPYWASIRPRPGTDVVISYQVEGPALGALLSALVTAAAPALASGAFGLAAGSFAFKLAVAGITAIGALVVNALIPPPSAPGPGTQDPAQFTITGFQNQVDRYGIYPKPLGRVRAFPKMTSRGYTETVDGEIFYRGRFTFGWGPMALSEIKIGNTAIENFDDVEIEFLNIDQTTTLANQPGLSSITKAWRSGTEVMTLCPDDVVEDQYSILLEEDTPVVRTTASRAESAAVDISFPQGLYELDSEDASVRNSRTQDFTFQYRAVGSGTWLSGGTKAITSKQNSQFRKTHLITFPTTGEYELRLTQTSANSEESNIVDEAYLSAIRTFRAGELPSHEEIAEVAIRVRATDQLNGQVDSFNAIAHQMVPIWNGSTWSAPQVSRHPAWIMADGLRGPHLRRPVQDSRLDLTELKDWADTEPHWTCDMMVEAASRVSDVIKIICAAGRAEPAMTDLKYSVIREKPSAPVRQVYTPRNSWGFKGRVVFPRDIHALRVKVRSERLDWQEDEIIVYADGYDHTNATEFETMPLPGVVITASEGTQGNAWRLGRYHLAVIKLRREVMEFSSDFERLAVQRGEPVALVHDVPVVGVGWGRITAIASSGSSLTSVTIDEVITGASGNYRMTVRQATGTIGSFTASAPVTAEDRVWTKTAGTVDATDLSVGDLVTIEETAQETLELLITRVQSEQHEAARLRLVPRAPAVATADSGTIPDYDPIITPPRDEPERGPAIPIVSGLISDGTTVLTDPFGGVQPRAEVQMRPQVSLLDAGVYLQAQWRESGTERWVQGAPVSVAQGAVLTEALRLGATYAVEVRSIGPFGRTRGWVSAGTVTAGNDSRVPPVPVYTAARTPSGQDIKNLVNGRQVTIRWAQPVTTLAGDAAIPVRHVEVWRGTSGTLSLTGGEPTNATLIGTGAGTDFIDTTSEFQTFYYYFLRSVAFSGLKSGFDSGRLVLTGAAADNRAPNGDFGAGSAIGWSLNSDLDEPSNPLRVSHVPHDPNSDFAPERTCPFPGMIKVEMGSPSDPVAEYEVNSTDDSHGDLPTRDFEHVLFAVDRKMPILSGGDVTVTFSMAELDAASENGWITDGDFPAWLRVYFYDQDEVQITAGQTFEDHYALILNDAAKDIWQPMSATFSPPDGTHFCSFEAVGLGTAGGTTVGFGVSYFSGFDISTAAGTQSISRDAMRRVAYVQGSDLVPSADDTTEVILTADVILPDLPANADQGEDIEIKVTAGGFAKTSGGVNIQFFLRLDGVNGNGIDFSSQTGLSLSDRYVVPAGDSYTIDLTMKTGDVSVSELDNGFLDVEAKLR